MWFPLEKTELSFIDRAPSRIENEILVFAPAARVFDVLAGDGLHEWLEPLVECRWTSPTPYGVGTTREIVLDVMKLGPGSVTAMAVKERFLAWDRGKRLAFAVEAVTMPLVKQMIEEMTLEKRGEDKTLLRYRVHYAPTTVVRAIHPIVRVVFGKMFKDATRKIAMIAARSGVSPAADPARAIA
ncbi:MAG: SRPBCC family protein [Polyangiales bacterium]